MEIQNLLNEIENEQRHLKTLLSGIEVKSGHYDKEGFRLVIIDGDRRVEFHGKDLTAVSRSKSIYSKWGKAA